MFRFLTWLKAIFSLACGRQRDSILGIVALLTILNIGITM